MRFAVLGVGAICLGLSAWPAMADTSCRTESFRQYMQGVQAEAAAAGVSPKSLALLDRIEPDPKVLARDRGQAVFAQSFLQFSDKLISPKRLETGQRLMRQWAPVFNRVEQTYGVPAAVITALWGLETDFGGYMGDFDTIRALATLTYDCRRPDFFRPQLVNVLKLADLNEIPLSAMKGAWAGEIGQTQFMPKDYVERAVDFDGDGKRDLVGSVPDVLGSTGNFLSQLGWQRGEPWLEEVRVPADMAWEDADIAIALPRAEWARRGVTWPNGAALPADEVPVSLILPMGRLGPAFFAYRNLSVLRLWNEAAVYSTTASYLAARLAGAPPVQRGSAPGVLSTPEMTELQTLLHQHGFDVGEVDGKFGTQTRAGVRRAQIKVGMPADAYPTAELLRRLRTVQ